MFFICFLFILLNISCEKKKNYEGKKLCFILSEMIEKDQRYRISEALTDPIFEILDSIRTAEYITKEEYIQFPVEKQLAYGKKARKIADKRKTNTKIADSLMQLQIVLDNENTERLIDIVKTRGYPNKENSPCEVFPGGVFIHSQKKYWDEIRILAEQEFKEKRMSESEYNFILYHINGRKPGDRYKFISKKNK